MSAVQTRRCFLTTASMAGVVGLVDAPAVLAAEGSLETTAVRFEKSAALCIAPQYLVEELLRADGFTDIRYDAMGNLIATYGAGTSGKSLMFIGNAMNQPASTMPNPYSGDVVDGKLMEAECEEDVFLGPAARLVEAVLQFEKGGKP